MTNKSWNWKNLFANFLQKSKPISKPLTGLDEGLRLAKLSSDKQGPEWQAAAYQAYVEHARRHKYFTTEDVRRDAKNVPKPTDPRAWGHIAKSAQKNGIIVYFEIMPSKSATTHGRYINIWQSTLLP
jgi:hypothetical protein